jgi:hypothetical protein
MISVIGYDLSGFFSRNVIDNDVFVACTAGKYITFLVEGNVKDLTVMVFY